MPRHCFRPILSLLVLLLAGSPTLAGETPAAPPPAPAARPAPPPGEDCAAPVGYAPWITTSVDLSKSFLDMRDNSLALDAAGRPHVAYGGDHLYYAYHDGTAWHVETVDAGLQVGIYASLALDAAGRPHIAYYDQANDYLRYAYHDGTAWQLQTVDADDGMC